MHNICTVGPNRITIYVSIGVGSRGAPGAGAPLTLNNILNSNFHQLHCSYFAVLWRVSFCDISALLSQNIFLRLWLVSPYCDSSGLSFLIIYYMENMVCTVY